jgi:CDP-diacylglycerol--glycerol-3-phosphate 3-phosphatidyltransferase
MLMTNENVVLAPHDRFMGAVFGWMPHAIRPNHLTVLRVFLTPCILVLLWNEYWTAAFWLFLFAALTDALDGSLARLRKQITLWGTMADPAADKFLIGSCVVVFVAREVNLLFAAVIVAVELLIIAGALYRRRQGKYASANHYGKIKMVLQVTGVALLILAKMSGLHLAVPFGVGTLALAIAFAVLSLLTYSS